MRSCRRMSNNKQNPGLCCMGTSGRDVSRHCGYQYRGCKCMDNNSFTMSTTFTFSISNNTVCQQGIAVDPVRCQRKLQRKSVAGSSTIQHVCMPSRPSSMCLHDGFPLSPGRGSQKAKVSDVDALFLLEQSVEKSTRIVIRDLCISRRLTSGQ